MSILDEIQDRVRSRIRNDQGLVGRRYAHLLPYHAVVTVMYDIQELLESLWTAGNDYTFREVRSDGMLVEVLEYLIVYHTEAGLARIPVAVQMGEDLQVLVEYEDLAGIVIERIKSNSN